MDRSQALDLLGARAGGAAFLPDQQTAWAMLAVNLHGQGLGIGLMFFGFSCIIFGRLIAESGVLPRSLG